MIDRTGKTCEKCKKGVYCEMTIHDDWEGKITCNKCSHRPDRWKKKRRDEDDEKHWMVIPGVF